MKMDSATAHANHDESLVVRLYGGDVDAQERLRALDLLTGCEECAALFADLGSIAVATAALPIPDRPRAFTLSAADAARLRRSAPAHGRSIWGGLTRQLGGAFAAIGLAGVMLMSAVTAFAPAASYVPTSYQGSEVALGGGSNTGDSPNVGGSPAMVDASNRVSGPGSSGSESTNLTASSPGAPKVTPAQSEKTTASPTASPTISQQGAGAKSSSSGQPLSRGGPDLRLAVLLASVGLLLVGLLMLVGPRLGSRRVRS